jgi:hypothetical protein
MRVRTFAVILLSLLALQKIKAETLQLVVGDDQALARPFAIDIDAGGNMYVALMDPHKIVRVSPEGKIVVIAGTGEKGYGGDGGPGEKARLNGPHHLLKGLDGHVYIADTWNNCIRKLDPKHLGISTFAGTGIKGFSGDGGPADKAAFGGVFCLAIDASAERMYVDDLDNKRIRMIDLKTNIVSNFAGNGQRGVPKDGDDAKTSPLQDPRAVAVDSKGNVYILERGGNCLRVVDGTGKIQTVVGTGKPGPCGDGGDALKTSLRGPKHLCCDAEDNVLIADTDNHSILKYTPKDGKVMRIAGTGNKGAAGIGGDPRKAELSQPHGVYIDKSGTIFISDSYNNRILKIVK